MAIDFLCNIQQNSKYADGLAPASGGESDDGATLILRKLSDGGDAIYRTVRLTRGDLIPLSDGFTLDGLTIGDRIKWVEQQMDGKF